MLADRLSELRSHLVTVEHGEQGAAVEVHDLDLQSCEENFISLKLPPHVSLKTPYKRCPIPDSQVDPVAAAEQVVQRVEHDIDAEIRHFIQQEVHPVNLSIISSVVFMTKYDPLPLTMCDPLSPL